MPLDVWEAVLYEAAYGGVRIDIVDIRTSEGNTLVAHAFPRRAGAQVDHQGNRQRVANARVCFFETVDQTDDHVTRYKAFRALCHDGEPHLFVHPFDGAFMAHVEGWEMSAAASTRDFISIDLTFWETIDAAQVLNIGAGTHFSGGVEVVRAQAEEVRALADDGGVDAGPIADLAIAIVDGWADNDELSAREVNLGLATASAELQALQDELEIASDLENYPLVRSLRLLHYEMIRAADSFVADTPRLIELTVRAATPLRVIAARTYGADLAETRMAEMVELNDISDPGLIAAGTVLKAPSATG